MRSPSARGSQPSLRIDPDNLNHHLWNNHGTWWIHLTYHNWDGTKERLRRSLRTRNIEMARRRRDMLLSLLSILDDLGGDCR